MLQRMSDQHKINFLDSQEDSQSSKKKEVKSKKTIQQIAESQKSKKLDNTYNNNGIMNSKSIFSATTGVISDEGGPTKFIKGESSNTLWDSSKTEQMIDRSDSKTNTIQEKKAVADNKRHAEEQRMNKMVEELKSTDLSKASSVSSSGTYSGSSYRSPINSMSIFDSKDFERLAEKTDGEKIKDENILKRDQKDDSWRGGSKSITAKEAVSEYFDNLLKKED